jgi:hypothetical protein
LGTGTLIEMRKAYSVNKLQSIDTFSDDKGSINNISALWSSCVITSRVEGFRVMASCIVYPTLSVFRDAMQAILVRTSEFKIVAGWNKEMMGKKSRDL